MTPPHSLRELSIGLSSDLSQSSQAMLPLRIAILLILTWLSFLIVLCGYAKVICFNLLRQRGGHIIEICPRPGFRADPMCADPI